MPLTKFEKQTIILNQFERTIRNANRSTIPTVIDREMARSAKLAAEFEKTQASKPAAPRISFYNPSNPLNGFFGKRKAEKLEILQKLKADKKAGK